MTVVLSASQVDGPYAWVVMVAALLHNLLNSGTGVSIAVYMLDWRDQYQASTTELAMIGSLNLLVSCISGIWYIVYMDTIYKMAL